jgi:hypothetical protein
MKSTLLFALVCAGAIASAVVLTACGGGDGGDASPVTTNVQPATPQVNVEVKPQVTTSSTPTALEQPAAPVSQDDEHHDHGRHLARGHDK